MKKEINMIKSKTQSGKYSSTSRKSDYDHDKIITDPFGSWTGVDVDNKYDKPIQDVDDL